MTRTMLAAAVLLMVCGTASAQDPYVYPRQISVTGTGTAWSEPDMATITFGVDVTGYSAAEAVDEASGMMRGARDAAVREGVDSDDIATSSYSLWTEYEYDEYTYEYTDVLLYHVSDYATLKRYDAESVGEVLAALVEGGANYISSVSFAISDRAALYDEARIMAVEDAQNRAGQLASATGVTLGEPTMISEYSYDYYDPYYGYGAMSASISTGEYAGGGMAPPAITPAEMSVQTSVTITYGIE
ncbi:MAG TPA: SIMPL domain-containing protein [Candidatus Fermentibacter sp.]|nr:SIMPL domain-containing protein [Candidatus Fermentibacter sp.]